MNFSRKYHNFVKTIFVTENQNNKVFNTSFYTVWCALSYETKFTFTHLTDVTNWSHRLRPCFLSQIDSMENVFPTWDIFNTINGYSIDYTINGGKSFIAALIVLEKIKICWKLSKYKKFDPVLLRVHISPEWIIRSSWNFQFLPNFIGAIYC